MTTEPRRPCPFLATALAVLACAAAGHAEPVAWRSMGEVLAASADADWRDIEPRNLLYLELDRGTVVMELAPQFAPRHVANLRRLVAAGHFSPAAIARSQDNYVVQWSGAGPLGDAEERLAPEFFRSAQGLTFAGLASRDAYAP